MTESRLRSILNSLFLISHSLTLMILVVSSSVGGFDANETKATLGILLPMFTVYTTAIVKTVIAGRHQHQARNEKTVSSQFSRITISLSCLFTIAIPLLVIGKTFNFPQFGDFVLYLGILESGFGVYLNMIIDELYKLDKK